MSIFESVCLSPSSGNVIFITDPSESSELFYASFALLALDSEIALEHRF